jgi:tRNA(Arg) A34 adenosine deaminase TadA
VRFPRVVLRLPDWVEDALADRLYPTVEDRMRLAVELSRLNVRHGTGAPFGAAIFERETGELLAPGVRHLVCGARDEDASAIGFDEGEKPIQWVPALERRGITVVRDVLREEAASVLREYVENGGEIYNARRGSS